MSAVVLSNMAVYTNIMLKSSELHFPLPLTIVISAMLLLN